MDDFPAHTPAWLDLRVPDGNRHFPKSGHRGGGQRKGPKHRLWPGWVHFDAGYFAKRRRTIPASPTAPEASSSRLEGSGVVREPDPESGAMSSSAGSRNCSDVKVAVLMFLVAA